MEAKTFRRKLLLRSLALRSGTEYVQPHEFGKVVARYLEGTAGTSAYDIQQLLLKNGEMDTQCMSTLVSLSQEVVGAYRDKYQAPMYRAALTILWLSLHPSDAPSLLADVLRTPAGISGKQKWALILPAVLECRNSHMRLLLLLGILSLTLSPH